MNIELIGTINDIQDRQDLQLVDRDYDIEFIKEYCGNSEDIKEFGGFFVKVGEGEYDEIYGFYGIIPELYKDLYKISL